ncbi:MAG: PDZ domain-containing protein [Clostridia bacterium]|nr:PDZ domain-containing protein [Clostridia bacterium]
MRKKISLSTLVTLIFLTVALTVSLTMMLAIRYFNNQMRSVEERQAMYSHINAVDRLVREWYPDLDEEVLRQALSQGYIYGIGDTYAAYYTPARYTAEQLRLAGKATNIGITLCLNSQGEITVGRVQPDSAAGKAGVQSGDVLTAVDGTEIAGKSLSELQTQVSSAEKMLLSVKRGKETLAYEMSAYKYTVRSVQSAMLSDTVGYIRITAFYKNTPDQFRAAVDSLLKQGATGLLFDLRNNAGGLPEAVQEVLSYVMPLGAYGTITDINGNVTKLSSNVNNQLGVSTVSLVNSGTAGEAEFFAGVLQEASLTTVVGQTTTGKAKYQEYFVLESDSSALKLTVGEYGLLKSGSWQGTGLIPAVEAELPLEQASVYMLLEAKDDAQIQAALSQFAAPPTVVTTTTTEKTKAEKTTEGTAEETTGTTADTE